MRPKHFWVKSIPFSVTPGNTFYPFHLKAVLGNFIFVSLYFSGKPACLNFFCRASGGRINHFVVWGLVYNFRASTVEQAALWNSMLKMTICFRLSIQKRKHCGKDGNVRAERAYFDLTIRHVWKAERPETENERPGLLWRKVIRAFFICEESIVAGKMISISHTPDLAHVFQLWSQDENGNVSMVAYNMNTNRLLDNAMLIPPWAVQFFWIV